MRHLNDWTAADIDDYFQRLRWTIWKYSQDLPDDYEVGIRLSNSSDMPIMHLRDVRLCAPFIQIVGLTDDGEPVQAVLPMPISDTLLLTPKTPLMQENI